MKLTIVADDKRVGVDELFFEPVELPQLDPTIHAVQWYGEYGEVEYKPRLEGGAIVKPANLLITDVTPFQYAVEAWSVVRAQAVESEQAASASAAAQNE